MTANDEAFACKSLDSPRPLSILLVNSFYAPFVVGGAEVVTEMLAKALAEQGHQVTVVTSCSRDRKYEIERREGVDIYRFFPDNLWWLHERFVTGDRRSIVDKLRWRVKDAWNKKAGARFEQILDRVRPDVLHTHNIKGFSPLIWHVARRRGIPVVHTGHSYELICADGSLLNRTGDGCAPSSRCSLCKVHGAWYRAQAAAIDVFCSPSNFLLRVHLEAGVVLKRTAHIRNGIGHRRSAPNSSEDSKVRPIRYLYMGQLGAHKGIDTLVNAIALASGASFTIDIAGRGEGEARLRALAETDCRVRFLGFVEGERKECLLLNADVLIFPSIWVENAPMSIAEAFCYGIPVIGSRIGAIPEFVEHGHNGLLFEVGNADALAACLTELAKRPEEVARLKRGARHSGGSWPTAETMARDYARIYRSVVPTKRSEEALLDGVKVKEGSTLPK